MKRSFKGFSKEGMRFLTQIAKNNDREFFAPRKALFDSELRLPMVELVREMHGDMLRFAEPYVGDPAKCVFRFYRDTRFSKDKTPYKDRVAAAFWRNGLGKGKAGFYFSVSPKEVEIAAGLYHPEPATLLAVRQYIAENADEFRSTFESKRMKSLFGELLGDRAARAPKGFDPAHPDIDLLRLKQFTLFTILEPGVALTPRLYDEVMKRIEAAAPFVEFLNRPLVGSAGER